MFSGKTTSKVVSLGGSSAAARSDRAQLLEQARREREKREQIRLHEQSATTLQAAWRNHCRLRAARHRAHDELVVTLQSTSWSSDEARVAVRLLIFLSRAQNHRPTRLSTFHSSNFSSIGSRPCDALVSPTAADLIERPAHTKRTVDTALLVAVVKRLTPCLKTQGSLMVFPLLFHPLPYRTRTVQFANFNSKRLSIILQT